MILRIRSLSKIMRRRSLSIVMRRSSLSMIMRRRPDNSGKELELIMRKGQHLLITVLSKKERILCYATA